MTLVPKVVAASEIGWLAGENELFQVLMQASVTQQASGAHEVPDTALRGTRLIVIRLAWVGIVTLTLLVSLAGFSALVRSGTAGILDARGFFQVTPEILTTLERLGLSTTSIVNGFLGFRVVGMLVFAVTGVVIFGLKSADRMIILVSLMLVTLGAALFAPLTMVTEEYPQWARLVELVGVAAPPWAEFGRSVAAVSVVLATYLIPDGRFVPRWSRWLGAALVAHVALWALLPASVFNVSRWAEPLDGLWVVGWLATGVFAQIYRFTLVSGPEERRQTRLVVFALTTAVSAFLLLSIFDPQLGSGMLDLAVVTDEVAAVYELLLLTILAVALLLFPLSIAFSVLRYRLWEIDVLINRALVYGSLTALVALVYLLGVVVLGRLLGALFGGTGVLGTEVALVGSTALVTLSFQPARRRVQAVVDRNFYRRKYDAARTLQAFSEQLRHDADLDHLVGDLLTVVRDTMQPAHVSLWLRPDVEQGALQAYRQEGTP